MTPELERLLEGLEPGERALAPGYLLMAAQDGELGPEVAAALEDRLAAADPALRAEWAMLTRAREAVGRVAPTEPAPGAWDRVFERLGQRGGDVDVAEVRAKVAGKAGKISLTALERKGFREVKVLRAGDINALIMRAVKHVFGRRRVDSLAQIDEVVAEARAVIDVELAARREATQALERLAAERDEVLRAMGGGGDPPAGEVRRSIVGQGLTVAGLRVPGAGEPVGDWFDLVEREAGGVDVVVGDASGRGLPAVMAAASARAALHALMSQDLSPRQVMAAANRGLCQALPRGTFVTAALARCEPSGRLVLAGAGAEPAVVLRGREGRAEALNLGGVVLGAVASADACMTERALELGPGDALVLVSDGVTEARSPGDEVFGRERLVEAVARHARLTPDEHVRALADEVRAWAGRRPLDDDLVVVMVRRNAT